MNRAHTILQKRYASCVGLNEHSVCSQVEYNRDTHNACYVGPIQSSVDIDLLGLTILACKLFDRLT